VLGAGDERHDAAGGDGERRPPLGRVDEREPPAGAGAGVHDAPAGVESLGDGVGKRRNRGLGRLDGGEHVAVAAHDRAHDLDRRPQVEVGQRAGAAFGLELAQAAGHRERR